MRIKTVTHIVSEADEVDAVRREQDVALGELAGLPRGLLLEQALDAHQPGPLLAGVHSAGHTEAQTAAALQQAHLERSFCNTETTGSTLSGPERRLCFLFGTFPPSRE